MLEYDFMRHAFAAATIVALVAGTVGYFLVLRGQTFAGHALSHVGFTGATGAVLIGVPPLWGLVLVTMLAGIGMGLLGEKIAQRDVAIGMVLAFALGLGLLFLSFFTAYATQATTLLFGNVLAVDVRTVWTLLALGLVSLIVMAIIARPFFSRACNRIWPRPKASHCGSTGSCFSPSSRSRPRNPHKSSASCWYSR